MAENMLIVDHGKELLKYLHDCWKKEIYCDVVVNVGTRTFKTHRFVLAMISEYLRCLLEYELQDQQTVTLHDVDGASFEAILKFAYTSVLETDGVDIKALVISADFLGITSVKEFCKQIIMKQVDKENCLSLLLFSDIYSMPELFECCKRIWCHNFVFLSGSTEFAQIPTKILLSLLEDKNLQIFHSETDLYPLDPVETEKYLFECVLNRLDSGVIAEVSDEMLDMLKAVKLPQLDYSYMIEKVKKYTTTADNPQILSLIELANSYPAESDAFPEGWHNIREWKCEFVMSEEFAYADQVGRNEYTDFDLYCLNPFARITRIRMWIRNWDGHLVVGGIHILHGDGKIVSAGGEIELNGMELFEVELQPGEVITKIIVHSGWMIDSLEFHTNRGRQHGPFGGDGGGKHEVYGSDIHNRAYLHSITCATVRARGLLGVVHLKFRWVMFE